MLENLLKLGLMDIGADDDRFSMMSSARDGLVERLKGDPSWLVPAMLALLDFDTPVGEPIYELTEQLVTEKWKTLRNAHPDQPRELLRSLLLSAIGLLSEQNVSVATMLRQIAASRMEHRQTRLGKERELVLELVQKSASLSAEAASLRGTAAKPRVLKDLEYRKIDTKESLTGIAAALGSTTPDGQTIQSSNPHSVTAGDDWTKESVPRLTAALVSMINTGTNRLASMLNKQVASLHSQLQVERSDLDMRIDVLWWHEAKYSPSQAQSYRRMAVDTLPLIMAFDLSEMIPAHWPESVACVLGETIHAIDGSRDEQLSLEGHLKRLAECGSELKELCKREPPPNGRVLLSDLTLQASRGKVFSAAEVLAVTGLDSTLMLTRRDLSVWILRDMQARRLSSAVIT